MRRSTLQLGLLVLLFGVVSAAADNVEGKKTHISKCSLRESLVSSPTSRNRAKSEEFVGSFIMGRRWKKAVEISAGVLTCSPPAFFLPLWKGLSWASLTHFAAWLPVGIFEWMKQKRHGRKLLSWTGPNIGGSPSRRIDKGRGRLRLLPFFWAREIFAQAMLGDRAEATMLTSRSFAANSPLPQGASTNQYWNFRVWDTSFRPNISSRAAGGSARG